VSDQNVNFMCSVVDKALICRFGVGEMFSSNLDTYHGHVVTTVYNCVGQKELFWLRSVSDPRP